MDATAEQDLLQEAIKRYELAEDAESTLRQEAAKDLRFAYQPGSQWDEELKERRGERPAYEYNRLLPVIQQIVNQQRQSRPGLKFRGVDSQADADTAEIYTGLARNIYSVSDGDTILDTAFEHAVAGGYGALGVTTEYSSDTGFDQELRLRAFHNPFMVQFDPSANDWLKRDARFAFVYEDMPREDFEEEFPEASTVPFDDATGTQWESWYEEDEVRIAEYWRRVPVQKEIALLSDEIAQIEGWEDFAGAIIELEPKIKDELEPFIARTRVVNTFRVEMYLITSHEVLDGPFEWVGKEIPLVPVYGRYINMEGEEYWSGVVRYAKDAMRGYNFHRTTFIETVALQPNAPFVLTAKQAEGLEDEWKNANSKLLGALRYNHDPQTPGPPQRIDPPQISSGLVGASDADAQDIMDISGMTWAAMGRDDKEQSGKSRFMEQEKGDTATFHYSDNLNKSFRRIGEILVDCIPKIYDTERVVRIIGKDGTEEFKEINKTVQDQQTGQPVLINDLQTGQYDVEVTTGPSYATQRMEAVESMRELFREVPTFAELGGDIYVKNLDIPEADEFHERLRRRGIQQGLIKPNPEDEEEMSLVQPDPQQQAMQEAMQQLAMAKDEADLREVLAKVDQTKVETAKKAGEADAARYLSEEKEASITGQNLDNAAKVVEIAIKRGELTPVRDPVTGQVTLQRMSPPDVDPQLHVGTGS